MRTPPLIRSIALFAALLSAGCERQPDAAQGQREPEAVVVTLGRTVVAPIQRSVEVVGTLYGDEETTISAKVSGRVVEVYKDVGDRAQPDEPLAQIEKVDYELARSQQELTMQETLTKLGLEALPGDSFDPSKVPTVQRARLQAANAEARFKRGQQLYQQDPPLISEQDFADLQTAYEVARSNYEVERLTARSLLAEAASRQSQLEQAVQRLRDTTVRAPVLSQKSSSPSTSPAGIFGVAARLVSVGEYLSQGTPMFRLVADNPLKYRAAVPERFSARVKIGQPVRVKVAAHRDVFFGTVTRVNPQVDVASRTFQVEALLPNDDARLLPGSFAEGSIMTHTDEQVTFAPEQAVVSFAGVTRIFTVEDGKAVEVRIEPGARQGDLVEIARGLAGAREVVIDNADKLANGTPVRIAREAAADAPVTDVTP